MRLGDNHNLKRLVSLKKTIHHSYLTQLNLTVAVITGLHAECNRYKQIIVFKCRYQLKNLGITQKIRIVVIINTQTIPLFII